MTSVVVEERLNLRSEWRSSSCEQSTGYASYPLVTTVQPDGMCVEIRFPGELDETTSPARTGSRARSPISSNASGDGRSSTSSATMGSSSTRSRFARTTVATGRSKGAATSQFAKHLLAVSGGPSAMSTILAPCGGHGERRRCRSNPVRLRTLEAVGGAHVHDYGKSWRPGRKLGHVTASVTNGASARVTAWDSARAYGTGTGRHSAAIGGHRDGQFLGPRGHERGRHDTRALRHRSTRSARRLGAPHARGHDRVRLECERAAG